MSQKALDDALKRLSNGKRITKAKDDSAGLAISTRLNTAKAPKFTEKEIKERELRRKIQNQIRDANERLFKEEHPNPGVQLEKLAALVKTLQNKGVEALELREMKKIIEKTKIDYENYYKLEE